MLTSKLHKENIPFSSLNGLQRVKNKIQDIEKKLQKTRKFETERRFADLDDNRHDPSQQQDNFFRQEFPATFLIPELI